jgi:putative tryptophan/tyrosine transport system substrate-binding protein
MRVTAFRQGLKEAGYVEGQNVTIEYRWAEGQYDRLPALAADLVRRNVTVIAATSTPAAQAAKALTSTVPIVFTTGDDPIKLGLVASFNRPGGNATGVSHLIGELGSKRLGLLRELLPGITVITTLLNPNFPGAERQLRDAEAAAGALGLQLIVLRASTEREIDAAFATMAQQGASLMSYGPSLPDLFRRAATYVHKILQGAKPSELPVEQPVSFELIVNPRTAKMLGITIPESFLLRADEVIE